MRHITEIRLNLTSLPATYLPTAYVVRGEGYVLTRVCPSIDPSVCLSTPRGGYPSQVQTGGGRGVYLSQVQGGGTPPHRTWLGGTPPWVLPIRPGQGGILMGVPHFGYPPVRCGWGVSLLGVPHLGYPPSDLARGVTPAGVPHLMYPPLSDLAGGYPDRGVPHLG